jgi:hypothetical protein
VCFVLDIEFEWMKSSGQAVELMAEDEG